MNANSMRPRSARLVRVAGLAAGALLLAGCLEKPGILDTWTRVDLISSNLTPYQSMTAGSTPAVSVRATITYRTIVTGFAVTELRASSTIAAGAVQVNPTAARTVMASDIDNVLAHSVTAGRQTRAVTGWDHLIQTLDFSFTGTVPATVDSAGVASPTAGLFLLTYLGSGQRIEFADGSDTLVVTPFPSSQYQILPIGMAFPITAPAP